VELTVLYRDERFVVVDKPPGVLVHRGREAADRVFVLQTLRDQIGRHVYPVHRLDRAASGVLAFALHGEAARDLQRAMQSDDAVKEYVALCRGETADSFHSDRPLTSDKGVVQTAHTEFERMRTMHGFSLLRIRIRTGRRHQIRRHLAHLAHHIVGDTKYGKGGINRWLREQYGLPRLFLHASHLRCGLLQADAPLAPDLAGFLDRFGRAQHS